jgi:uncharacterized Zn-binding protein involved in type VI secretion
MAARITDNHTCPMVDPGPKPHVGGPVIAPGCPTVLVEDLPAARVGDGAMCAGPPDVIVMGAPDVLIGDRPAARVGDPTAHGGVLVSGATTVLIGVSAQAAVLKAASKAGAPFCEKCPLAKSG